jgi:enamine deaminase RidA (YjgF/YER057c/UK114 family)
MRDPNKQGRYLYSTRSKFEFQFGYSRAVRHGRIVRIAGTAGLDEDGNPVQGGAAAQTRRALEIIEDALKQLGADFSDVIMTRIYVKDTADIIDVAVLHGEIFREIRPATTIVQSGFIHPGILVEIEMEAIYGGKDDSV